MERRLQSQEPSSATPRRATGVDGRSSLILLTSLTATLALAADDPLVDAVLRPLYFATLFAFFHRVWRQHRGRIAEPLRVLCAGFLVLTLASATSAVIRQSGADLTATVWSTLLVALDRGGIFLLGMGLVSYGTVLWIPRMIESQELLRAGYGRARGQLEDAERARENLEAHLDDAARLQALGEMAAGVAHDLRNPLAVVRGCAASLRRKPRDGADLQEHLDVIDRNLARAERTIQALLDLGRPGETRRETVALGEILEECRDLVAPEARRLGVALRILPAGAQDHDAVATDPSLLKRSLVNLALNAVQVSQRHAAVRLGVRRFAWRGAPTVALFVLDDGPGIPPAARSQLFKPFYTTRQGGTGLGLLSVRRAADELGGRVGLFPRRAGGCRALFLLPSGAPQREALPGPVETSPPQANEAAAGTAAREVSV